VGSVESVVDVDDTADKGDVVVVGTTEDSEVAVMDMLIRESALERETSMDRNNHAMLGRVASTLARRSRRFAFVTMQRRDFTSTTRGGAAASIHFDPRSLRDAGTRAHEVPPRGRVLRWAHRQSDVDEADAAGDARESFEIDAVQVALGHAEA
jgi:hypothetical protein